MATPGQMRARLREAGEEVPHRGRLSAEAAARYEELAADEGWDLPDEADSGDSMEADEPSVPMQAEKAPRTARSDRKARRARPVGERLLGPRRTAGKAKPRHKRISVDHLISRTWEGVARFAAPMSLPLSRCLQVQSPVAGMILEEIVQGTVVDRALQPIARAEEKAEKVLALVGPPLLVLALEQTAMMPPQQAAMRQALIMPLLKESLRMWLQVAGPKVEEAARRESDYQQQYGMTIDAMIELFFAPVQTTAEQVEPEMAGASA
jgi:hypothetical protein